VPSFLTDELVYKLTHTYTQPVQYVVLNGATHDGAVFQSTTTVANWIAGRFS